MNGMFIRQAVVQGTAEKNAEKLLVADSEPLSKEFQVRNRWRYWSVIRRESYE